MGFCIICLRQDRRVRFVDNLLAEFHDELCDFGVPSTDNHYCSECEHLLSKFFKFRKQCVMALKLYVKWKAKKCSTRPPMSQLQAQLEPPTLSHWNPSSRISHIFISSDMESKPFGDKQNSLFQFEHCYTVPDSDHSQDGQVEVKLEAKDRTDDALILDIKQEKHDPCDNTSTVQNFTIEGHDEEPTTTIKENVKKNRKMKIKPAVKKTAKEKPKVKEQDNNEYLDDEFFDSLTQISLSKDSDASDDNDDDDDTDYKDEEIKPNPHKSRADYVNTKNKLLVIQKMKEDVIQKVSLYDNIVANDGTPMEKDMVIEGIRQHKLARETLARMQRALRGSKDDMSSKARELLAMVYKTAQEDVMYGEVFDIQYLPTMRLKAEEFKNRKSYVSYIKSKYQCEICFLPFINNKTKELHIKECHDESKESVVCPVCDVRLNKDPVRIRRHNLNHDVVYKCKMCPTVTYDRGTMKLHYNRHKGKSFRCDPCNMTFKSMSGYYLHRSVYHNKVKHVCTTCGRGFSTQGALKTHIGSKTHPINPAKSEDPSESVRCDVCDVTLPSRAVYDAHVNFVHVTHARTDDVQRTTRVYRARKKASQRQYVLIKCRLCNKSNRGGGWLKWHFQKEHPTENWAEVYPEYNKHLCDVCGASFKNIFHLRTHMNIHTGALPFACNICHKKFRSTILLKSHTSRHFAPSHLCYQCGKKFHTRSNLIRHYKCHTGEKANKCEICGKSFFAASNLKEHVNSVHHHVRKVRNRKETTRKIIQEITPQDME